MSTPERAPRPRNRSAFAAAFLSLIFPGLGHLYDGAYVRALGFAALPLLALALGGGIALRSEKTQLLGMLVQPTVLWGLLVGNILFLIYRIIAAVDAWQVARFLNAQDASGDGRLGRAKLPINPISVAGLVIVLVVMAAGHLAVARYNVMAMNLVDCVFSPDSDAANCQSTGDGGDSGNGATAQGSGDQGASQQPGATGAAGSPDPGAGGDAQPTDEPAPTPDASATGTIAPTLPPWDGKERLNILLIGSDQRPGDSGFNTDTMIVVSIDPVTKQVAMFQLPRDTVDVPVPDNATGLWGSVYRGKINSWYNQNRNRTDLWAGKKPETRGMNALKAILGQLYGLDIRYYVKVDFGGFQKAVDTLGGVLINVQMPVYESMYPSNGKLRRLYIPAGPQQMDGAEALMYARSRHRASGGDFDRGRRQQRVLISLREQMSAQAIVANLQDLVQTLGQAVKTDIPVGEMPKLLALADGVDTKNIRSYVFSPPYYATESVNSPRGYIIQPNLTRIRKAVQQAFSLKPEVLALRDRLAAEAARVWVLNGSGRIGAGSDTANYLSYYGLDASAPNQKTATTPTTKIVVYNGAEADMTDTIAYLEKLYGVKATTATDPTVTVDIVVTMGKDAPKLQVDAVG